jgi:hypothetical protein
MRDKNVTWRRVDPSRVDLKGMNVAIVAEREAKDALRGRFIAYSPPESLLRRSARKLRNVSNGHGLTVAR